MMEKQQHIPMRKHEYGFTLIELIVILGLLSTILGLSFGGYKTISTKSQKKKSEELAHKVYYSLIELITNARNVIIEQENGKYIYVTYPYYAQISSKSGEYIDDLEYDIFCKYFLNKVFSKYENLMGGTYEYQPVSYSSSRKNVENDIIYHINNGKFIFKLLMTNNLQSGYDGLNIISVTYIDEVGNDITLNV